MYANVPSNAVFVSTSLMVSSTSAQWQEAHAGTQQPDGSAVVQNTTEYWDVEKQMMFYSTPGSSASTSANVQVQGGYNPSEEVNGHHFWVHQAAAPESVEVGGTTYFFEIESEVEYAPTDEIQQPIPIEVAGTTYYWPASGSLPSSYSSSEESASPPQEVFDEYDWSAEFDQEQTIADGFETIHETFQRWIMDEDQMRVFGYPSFDESGQVQMEPTFWERSSKPWISEDEPARKCSRCHMEFAVDAEGRFPTGLGICHHTTNGQWRAADNHISTQRFTSELEKFVATPAPNGEEDERSDKIFALDAEMVATTAGFALARLSVVDFDGQLQLDVLVRPEAQVVDYLTEFSGITKEMLNNATHSLESCRNLFFEMVNSKTILIGHGLESDLKSLRLVHRNVIDSSILYLDTGNKKVALRKLAKEHLGRTIQADNSETFGHCSEEDALASLDLVKHRIFSG